MAETIKIQLSDNFESVTKEDVQAAKNFVLRRESAARGIASLVDGLLEDAAEKITLICYRYGIDPKNFQLSAAYNEEIFKEVAAVMDELEEEILDLTADYSTRCTKDKDKKQALFLWMLTLGKGGKAYKATIEDRLRSFMKDLEAMIAVAKLTKLDATKAVTRIKGYLHTVYQMPGMQQAFKDASTFKAVNIRNRGVKKGNRGSSNSEANNIGRMVKTTVQMTWMRYHHQLAEENGAVGFWVGRGSTYPCSLCDSMVGFHQIGDTQAYPPFHASCCCWAVPVYERDINELTL